MNIIRELKLKTDWLGILEFTIQSKHLVSVYHFYSTTLTRGWKDVAMYIMPSKWQLVVWSLIFGSYSDLCFMLGPDILYHSSRKLCFDFTPTYVRPSQTITCLLHPVPQPSVKICTIIILQMVWLQDELTMFTVSWNSLQ